MFLMTSHISKFIAPDTHQNGGNACDDGDTVVAAS
jgi:hypothetical protein